jgi:streptogramin lyase
MRKPFGAFALLAALLVVSGAVAGGTASGTAVLPREVRASQSGVVGPSSITAGPDGAVWFTESNNAIGRITTAGVVTNFTDPSIASPAGITAGSDGALWFTNFNNSSIGRITTSGVVTNFTDPSILFPLGIASGPDGALWFINAGAVNAGGVNTNGSIGRITTAGAITNYTDNNVFDPISIAAGSDGALWFTNYNSIGRITTSGTFAHYTSPSIVNPIAITSSSCNGALWFTNDNDSIGFIDPANLSNIFSITDPSVAAPDGITAPGPGCDVWFTNQQNNAIGHIQPSGVPGGWTFSHFSRPSISRPVGITTGTDGALWFTNYDGNSIGRITTSGTVTQMTASSGALSQVTRAPSANQTATATPSARVGVFYFDGWGGPLSNYHFDGLARPGPVGGPPNGQFPERQPLYGWRDDTVETMRTQLAWARQAGIGFFNFEWYNYSSPPSDPINGALGNYMKLKDHNGVGFALSYIIGGLGSVFNVPLDQLPAVADKWVTQYFLNPNYVKINGKPLLTVTYIADAVKLYGDPDGINQAIDIIQNAAKAHGLPGVYIVGLRSDYQQYCEGIPNDCLAEDGHQSQQHWDAISQLNVNQLVAPVDGPTPFTRLINEETQVDWPAWAQQTVFPYIPSLGFGWDARSTGGQVHDSNGTAHMFWTVRTPSETGQFLTDAIDAANQNPELHVSATPGAPPIIFMQSWNELFEGAYIVPTIQNGYADEQAIATAVGLPWQTTHPRRFVSAKVAKNKLTGTLAVTDSWSPCVDSQTVVLQRKSGTAWAKVASASTQPGGSFTMKFPTTAGSYRLLAAPSTAYRQTCAATTLKAVGTPGAPTAVAASAGGGGTATVKWKAPTITNGAPVTGYVITPIKAGVAQKPVTFKSTATTQTISGLIAGKSYTFKVAATNTRGTGTQSAASKPITAK